MLGLEAQQNKILKIVLKNKVLHDMYRIMFWLDLI